ncbi:uncharacterized protein LOC143642817 isoform X4 [Tamandua tetradactyla]|uniref:uncharacterized protein LOC143642817 isoform X4 n=1 Tax=Tamandua tetradactyla TaxID=48850 RepID=UPI0040538069
MNWLGDRFKKSSEMVAWLDKLLEELSACLTSHGKGEVCRTLGREEKKEEEKIRGEAAVLPGHRLEKSASLSFQFCSQPQIQLESSHFPLCLQTLNALSF